ncbi:MAG TPA: ABC transporter permease [Candidatus Lokiarchaeia archaeon]|nr:ABC transporter permease [Candidatus Lokiarchaeia archaeon]
MCPRIHTEYLDAGDEASRHTRQKSPRITKEKWKPEKNKVTKRKAEKIKVARKKKTPVDNQYLDRLIRRVGFPLIVVGLLGIIMMPNYLFINIFVPLMLAGIILIVVCIVKEFKHSKYMPIKEMDED